MLNSCVHVISRIVIVIERGSWGNDISRACWARLRHDVPEWEERADTDAETIGP